MPDTTTAPASTPSAPAAAAIVGSATTTESAGAGAQQCVAGRQITASEGARIVAAAAEWKGTPYSLIGPASQIGVGGDCSGSTHKIYAAAGFPYSYRATAEFRGYVTMSHRFVEITDGSKQPGDILWWPGHVAVYAEFTQTDPEHETSHTGRDGKTYKTKDNNMWSATHTGGDPYGSNDYRVFRAGETPKVFRYFLHHGEPGC